MFWSMAPLVLACIVLAGMLGHVLVSAPTGPGQGPDAVLRRPGRAAGRRRRAEDPDPAARGCPRAGRPTPVAASGIDGGRTDPASGQPARAVASTVGYLAPTRHVLSLTQSNADEDKLVGSINPDV